jgi:hypothetical protein
LIVRKIKGLIIYAIIFSIILILLALGVVDIQIVVALLIGALIAKADIVWKYFFNHTSEQTEKIISSPWKKPEFKAEIVNKQNYYRRGQDSIHFRSKYKGKIKNGYFLNEIEIEDKSIDNFGYRFNLTTNNVNPEGTSVRSYCPETIGNINNPIGNLDGNIDTNWKYWNWDIPHDAPVTKYIIKMMVLNEGNNEQPLQMIEDNIEIIMPTDPSNPFDRPPRI